VDTVRGYKAGGRKKVVNHLITAVKMMCPNYILLANNTFHLLYGTQSKPENNAVDWSTMEPPSINTLGTSYRCVLMSEVFTVRRMCT